MVTQNQNPSPDKNPNQVKSRNQKLIERLRADTSSLSQEAADALEQQNELLAAATDHLERSARFLSLRIDEIDTMNEDVFEAFMRGKAN